MIFYVADDDKSTQTLCRLILQRMNVARDIRLASNGQQVWEQLQEDSDEERKVVFLDLNMPVMDGAQFLKEIESNPLKGVEVYLMLTNDLKADDRYLMDNPFVKGALSKPLDPVKIQNIL
ncbi:response regulator [bacterium SCSIO 12741]|nr:response regulator [bacterium SCSIO 12741]